LLALQCAAGRHKLDRDAFLGKVAVLAGDKERQDIKDRDVRNAQVGFCAAGLGSACFAARLLGGERLLYGWGDGRRGLGHGLRGATGGQRRNKHKQAGRQNWFRSAHR